MSFKPTPATPNEITAADYELAYYLVFRSSSVALTQE